MIRDLIIIPNFFDNPAEIVELAKKQKYYELAEHPDKFTQHWNGNRSLDLNQILEYNQYNKFSDEIVRKIFKECVSEKTEFDYTMQLKYCFHSLLENDNFDDKNLHRDGVLYSALIYLNENIKSEEYGTMIYNSDNSQRFIMQYEYNTFVMYRGDYVHGPMNGFGDSVENSRLTLNMFVDNLNITLKHKRV